MQTFKCLQLHGVMICGKPLISCKKSNYMLQEGGLTGARESLSNINVDVYEDISPFESLMLAAQYQSQQSSKSILFQDRIRVARRCFETGITNWKKEAVETLEVLDGKRYSEGSVSTVLTTASFSADNYKLALELFDEFSISRPDTSFPQTLFRRLQGVSEDNRTRYLLKAAGTNGLRAAKMIDEDKRRETLKALATSSCECEWESLGDDVTTRLMNYPGNIDTAEGRQRFKNFVSSEIEGEEEEIEIIIIIKKNGNDITKECNFITQKYIEKLRSSVKKYNKSTYTTEE